MARYQCGGEQPESYRSTLSFDAHAELSIAAAARLHSPPFFHALLVFATASSVSVDLLTVSIPLSSSSKNQLAFTSTSSDGSHEHTLQATSKSSPSWLEVAVFTVSFSFDFPLDVVSRSLPLQLGLPLGSCSRPAGGLVGNSSSTSCEVGHDTSAHAGFPWVLDSQAPTECPDTTYG